MDTELNVLFDEVRLLFNALVQRGEKIHSDQTLTMAQRAVLEFLHNRGPTTVPGIARQRRVSRQHIQTLVNPLLKSGHLRVAENPEHKRSPLVSLTPDGEKAIVQMQEKESEFFRRVNIDVSRQQLEKTADTLRAVRTAIERDEGGSVYTP